MEAVRKIYRQLPDVLKMPKELQQQRVEVILLPLGTKLEKSRRSCRSAPLARFAGAWHGLRKK